jgi:hypothetical protein
VAVYTSRYSYVVVVVVAFVLGWCHLQACYKDMPVVGVNTGRNM